MDLPDPDVRAEIFRIHLGKRGMDPKDFDLAALAETADGFTGAEIEEAVVSARYLAGSRNDPTRQEDVLAALNRTYPMSILRAESIASLRAWAENRTVKA